MANRPRTRGESGKVIPGKSTCYWKIYQGKISCTGKCVAGEPWQELAGNASKFQANSHIFRP